MASRALSPERLDAFSDEMSKTAGIEAVGRLGKFLTGQVSSVGRGARAAGDLLIPGRAGPTLSKGWRFFEPVEGRVQELTRELDASGVSWDDFAGRHGLPRDMREAVRQEMRQEAQQAKQQLPKLQQRAQQEGAWAGRSRYLGGTGSRGELRQAKGQAGKAHLSEEGVPLTTAWRNPTQLAEELSRRGWTGRGGVTKYMPVGGKSWTAGFGAGLLPGAVGAKDPYGEGKGRFQRLGEHAGTQAGFVAGLPTGLLGSFTTAELARRGLGAVGKGVDTVTGQRQLAGPKITPGQGM